MTKINKGEKEHSYLYYDIMYPLWNWYHRWILHFRWSISGKPFWFASCEHMNPYDVLTPRRFQKQIDNIKKSL